jgi:DNA-binding MarR family transcriptional regulator
MEEGLGLIFKKQDPMDLRTWRVFLTDKGRAVARRMQLAWSKSGALNNGVSELGSEDEVSDWRSEAEMTDEDNGLGELACWNSRHDSSVAA